MKYVTRLTASILALCYIIILFFGFFKISEIPLASISYLQIEDARAGVEKMLLHFNGNIDSFFSEDLPEELSRWETENAQYRISSRQRGGYSDDNGNMKYYLNEISIEVKDTDDIFWVDFDITTGNIELSEIHNPTDTENLFLFVAICLTVLNYVFYKIYSLVKQKASVL